MCGHTNDGKIFLIQSNSIGVEGELGLLLMRSFLTTLAAEPEGVEMVLFLNSGVMLTTEGAETLSDIELIEKSGAPVYSCGTCLDYFNIKDKLAVGKVGSMSTTVAGLTSTAQVVTVG